MRIALACCLLIGCAANGHSGGVDAVTSGPDVVTEPSPRPGDPFTLAAIPDPQYLTEDTPTAYHPVDAPYATLKPLYRSMTNWISNNAAATEWNIRFTIPLGDMVDDGFSMREWGNAADMYAQLQDANGSRVQYGPLAGNHDTDVIKEDGTCDDPTKNNCGITDHDYTNLNAAFPKASIASMTSYDSDVPYFYSSYPFGTVTNTAYGLRAGGVNWLIIHLAWFDEGWGDPHAWDAGALGWANQLIADAPEKQVIIATHSCLSPKDPTGPAPHEGTLNGEKTHLWNGLAKLHPNVTMVVCGHVGGASARSTFPGDAGNPVQFLVSDFQTHAEAAPNTFVRRMRLDPTARTVTVSTYSEFEKMSLTDVDNAFTLTDFPFLLANDNVARTASVSTSSTTTTESVSWQRSNLVDGHRAFGTAGRIGWSSKANATADAPEWVELDLGASTWVRKVYLFGRSDSAACREGGLPVNYTIETSLDGVTFDEAASIVDAQPPSYDTPRAHAFAPRQARYVRIAATKLSRACATGDTSYRFQLGELEVY